MRVELLENTERRRRWSFDDKARIVEASFETGVSVCSVARRHGIAQGLLFTWRRQAREGRLGGDAQAPVLVPVAIAPEPSRPVPAAQSDDPRAPAPPRRLRRKSGVIDIDLGGGRRLTVDRDVDAAALRRVLDALEGR
ncbi:transposase [Methylobacterium sp. WL103]|uniref:IS66-like element accessory protein TnpA n=1 Tax=Methylobacterium sp. WL103 TaxID=2603891 RepID=UPI0011CA3F1A|nr:transposase [Methylobacterium sp. WL103]TXN07074.1 transposase [Methylobacterium sp. WL103]